MILPRVIACHDLTPLRVQVEAPPSAPEGCGPAPAADAALDQAWQALCAANPRLFDAPIWSVHDPDPAAGTLRVRPSSFRRLCAQRDPRVGDLGVRLLGVKCVLLGHDARGHLHIRINRRHPDTRVYGGLWEMGPGGGVGPRDAPDRAGAISEDQLLQHLANECQEELGLDLLRSTRPPTKAAADQPSLPSAAPPRAAPARRALMLDEFATSVDVVFVREMLHPIDPRAAACRAMDRDWEYIDSAWLARGDVPAFAGRFAGAISPTARALWAWLGWLGS